MLAAVMQNFVTVDVIKATLLSFAEGVADIISPLKARVAALEKRCKELEARSSGVTIVAEGGVNMHAPDMTNVVSAMERLDASLNKPIKSIYDKDGNVVG